MDSVIVVDLPIVGFYGRHEAPDEFAGTWHSPGDDLNFVRFVGDPAAHLKELRPRLRYPAALRALPADFSLAHLTEIAYEISDAFDGGGAHVVRNGAQIEGITPDFELNKVVVELYASDKTTLEQEWESRYGGAVQIEVVGPSGTLGQTRLSGPRRTRVT
jgi:hypothetical protein